MTFEPGSNLCSKTQSFRKSSRTSKSLKPWWRRRAVWRLPFLWRLVGKNPVELQQLRIPDLSVSKGYGLSKLFFLEPAKLLHIFVCDRHGPSIAEGAQSHTT